jgi:integrase
MAGLSFHPKTGVARIHFRFGGLKFHKSLKTVSPEKAERQRKQIEETLDLLQRGVIPMPADANAKTLWHFIRSDRRIDGPPKVERTFTLSQMFAWYFEQLPTDANERSTLKTAHIHQRHFLRVLGERTAVATITGPTIQAYVNRRANDRWRKRPIGARTIKKEIETLQRVWNLAHKQNKVRTAPPTGELNYPKEREKQPFQTWDEIEATIARGNLTKQEKRELWECVFLDVDQIAGLLEFVKTKRTRSAYFYAVIVLAAHTGARLSEIIRSRIEDLRLDRKNPVIVLREKKKKKGTVTLRQVPMSSLLCQTMRDYFKRNHPGGPFTISIKPDKPMLESTLHEAFDAVFAGTKWEVLKGFHVFRHSFASNLALQGVDPREIDGLMGHQTEAMRKRYQHLFPQQRMNAIKKLFG